MPSSVQHLTLDNGLQVILRHAPQLKRCAAAVRVQAGSHDAPRAYAGLAHFLEHLLFLGTQRFPVDDGLMRYVQRHGGQVNASTRERSTDYFFEVPQAAFAGGLERLCDMLAHPCFDLQQQLREREVIHAEFIAWSRNPQAQAQFALLQSVSSRHPLHSFQAGNRYSLPVHNPAFQAALSGYHQRYYQAGQMILSLCGPQSLEQLQMLARSATSSLASAEQIERSAPVKLADSRLAPRLSGQQLDLLHVIEQQPPGLDQAIDYLNTWLTDARPGGLVATLRQRGWLHSIDSAPLYSFAGQALLHTRLRLNDAAVAAPVQELLQDWLRFFRDADRTLLNQEYARLQQSRAQTASALELACRDSAARPFAGMDRQAEQALDSLLNALLEDSSAPGTGPWHLPAPEPLLNVHFPDTGTHPLPAGLTVSPLLPPARRHGVVYIRWQVSTALRDRLWPVVNRALHTLKERAPKAGASVQLDSSGEFWQLRCAGLPNTVASVTQQALYLLQHPSAADWTSEPMGEPENMPIRALLRLLPEHLFSHKQPTLPDSQVNKNDLQRLWAQARWQAMACGFEPRLQHALNAALQQVPGHPGSHQSLSPEAARRWKVLAPRASEQALLLFCPLAAADEACGRLLAQHLQGPFYQRLRVELQLGYAVFSAFRQLQGCSGLLFGVQSANASHEQILSHIHEFLAPLPSTLRCNPEARLALAEQMDEAVMSNADVAEWAWQAQLAGRERAQLTELKAAILGVDEHKLRQCAADLLHARQGWICLANGPAPDTGGWVSESFLSKM